MKRMLTALFALLLMAANASAVIKSVNGTITALNGTVTVSGIPAGGTECGVAISGTFTGTLTFQGTVDETNWISIPAVPPSTGTLVPVSSMSAAGATTGTWIVPCGAYHSVRMNATAWTSGTATVYMVVGTGSTATLVMGASSVSTTQGTATADTGTVLQSAATGNGNGTTLDVTGYSTLHVVIDSSNANNATVNFEVTANNSTWVGIVGVSVNATSVGGNNSTASTQVDGTYYIPVAGWKTFRARIGSYGSGTYTVTAYRSTAIAPRGTQYVSQAGTWSVGLSGAVTISQASPGSSNATARTVFSNASPTIATGAGTSSSEIDLLGVASFGIIFPADWTQSDVTFTVSDQSGGTFVPLKNDAGITITIASATASTAYGMESIAGTLFPWRYLKIKSTTSQGGTKTLIIAKKS